MTISDNGGLYVHIPFCVSRCRYCNFVSCTDFSRMRVYVNALIKEIRARSCGGVFDSVYFGGGTPSALYRGGLREILGAIRDNYTVVLPEITVECNPDSADEAFFAECADIGVNRFSIGLQTTDDILLKAIGRPHTYRQFADAFASARRIGETNVDLMLGLPGQTTEDLIGSVETVCALGPDHISLYALKVEPGTPLYASGYRPDEDGQAAMYDEAYRRLRAHGYDRYEVSNFARGGRVSRHNCKYWTMRPYLGFGAAAHSFTGSRRIANTDSIAAYIAGRRPQSTEETAEDYREEYVMLALRTAAGIDLADYKRRFGTALTEEKARQTERLVKGGFIEIASGHLTLTEDAFYVMNAVIAELI